MQDGMFVLDCVVHVLDYRHEMTVHPDGDVVRDQIVGFNAVTARKGPPENPDIAAGPPDFDWCNDMLFGRSNTDVAMVQAVPLFGLYREGVGPFDLALEYYESNKDRLMLCGGVDPLYQGIKGACDEMRRQVELGAKSIKFYQAQSPRDAWKADDRSLAYPLYEKAQELGIKMVQFHKGLPLGRQRVEDLAPNDIQTAAFDFPDLNFGLHHLGRAVHRRDDRHRLTLRQRLSDPPAGLQPVLRAAAARCSTGSARRSSTAARTGSATARTASSGRTSRPTSTCSELQMPEDLQDGYGYPALTRETREKILGLNFARGAGLDIEPYRRVPEGERAVAR